MPTGKRLIKSVSCDMAVDRSCHEIDSRATGQRFETATEDQNNIETERRIFVLDAKPQFLEGHVSSSFPQVEYSTIKEPQGRMAIAARQGSALVHNLRSLRERQKKTREAVGVSDDRTKPKKIGNTDGWNKLTAEESRKQRERLPAAKCKEDILNLVRENQIVIVVGETGSGKTTQLPQFLFDAGYKSVVCTQPRRIAARSVAERVAAERGCDIGSEVGYSIRFEDRTSTETSIKFVTDGILIREILGDSVLDRYSCVIIDEAHERSLNTDILLGLTKLMLQKRSDLKVLITSATLNSNLFASYFGGAPLYTIPGRTWPVQTMHVDNPVDDYVASSVQQALKIHLSEPLGGDILVFMTGQDDIQAFCDDITSKLIDLEVGKPMEVLPFYSQLPNDLQERVFFKTPPGVRKCVVSTNIAETSITVDGIKYVIDSGFAKLKVYKPSMGLDALQTVPIARSNALQRSGRAGRTSKGWAFRMYTKAAEEDEMYEQQLPEIQRANLSSVILLLKSLGIDPILDFPWLSQPPSASLVASCYELWVLDALDSKSGAITKLGLDLVAYPMDPSMARVIIAGIEANCASEILTILAMLCVPSVYVRTSERAKQADRAHERFIVSGSDHLTLLNVYDQWETNRRSSNWASENFLQPKSLWLAANVREQLIGLVGWKGVKKSRKSDWERLVRRSICKGYFHHAAQTRGLNGYTGLRNNADLKIHPTSALHGISSNSPYVIYHELILTSQQYMMVVTEVDAEWLLEDGAKFYYTEGSKPVDSVDEADQEYSKPLKRPRFERKRARLPKRTVFRGV